MRSHAGYTLGLLLGGAFVAQACNSLWGLGRLDFSGGSGGRGGAGGTALTSVPSAAEGTGGCSPVPAVPTDWNGPMALYSGASPPPVCDAGGWAQASDGGFGVDQGGACSCTCTVPDKPCDGLVSVTYYADASCAGTESTQNVTSKCVPIAAPGAVLSVNPHLLALFGSCQADQKPPPAAIWSTLGRLCTHAPGSCVNAPIGFNHVSCISHAGAVSCPQGTAYSTVRTLFRKLTDTRKCSACACGPLKGAPCKGLEVALYNDSACKNSAPKVQVDGSCHDIGPGVSAVQLLGSPSGGMCDPSGGTIMSGEILTADPLTVCCTD